MDGVVGCRIYDILYNNLEIPAIFMVMLSATAGHEYSHPSDSLYGLYVETVVLNTHCTVRTRV